MWNKCLTLLDSITSESLQKTDIENVKKKQTHKVSLQFLNGQKTLRIISQNIIIYKKTEILKIKKYSNVQTHLIDIDKITLTILSSVSIINIFKN